MTRASPGQVLAFLHSLASDKSTASLSHGDPLKILRILGHLSLNAEGLTVGDIAKVARVHPTALGRALDRMWKMGIITELYSPGDRRVTIVQLTRKGAAITERVEQLYRNPPEIIPYGRIRHRQDTAPAGE